MIITHLYILGTILFTVYGQVIIKWRIPKYGALPAAMYDKVLFLFSVLLDPFILSGLISAFVASLCWMAAMTKFDLSYAYPFVGITYLLIFLASMWFFNEPFSYNKLLGVLLIMVGIFISSRT